MILFIESMYYNVYKTVCHKYIYKSYHLRHLLDFSDKIIEKFHLLIGGIISMPKTQDKSNV